MLNLNIGIFQVERATANPSHAFSRFSTGTRQTLDLGNSSDRNLRYSPGATTVRGLLTYSLGEVLREDRSLFRKIRLKEQVTNVE